MQSSIMNFELYIMKRSSPLRQLAPIFHAKLAENNFVGYFVEHFEHNSVNIYCRGVLG
jgi:hypothetical protein